MVLHPVVYGWIKAYSMKHSSIINEMRNNVCSCMDEAQKSQAIQLILILSSCGSSELFHRHLQNNVIVTQDILQQMP